MNVFAVGTDHHVEFPRLVNVVEIGIVIFQLVRSYGETHLTRFSCRDVHSYKILKFFQRPCYVSHRITKIHLYDLYSVALSDVSDIHSQGQLPVFFHNIAAKRRMPVFELRIAHSITEGIERFVRAVDIIAAVTVEQAFLRIGMARHQMIVIQGYLTDTTRKSSCQLSFGTTVAE